MRTTPVDDQELSGVWGFSGQTVAVAGGSSGIGAAVAQLALKDGARVISLSRRPSSIPGVLHAPLDLRDSNSIREAADTLASQGVSVLAICSGLGGAEEPLGVVSVNFLGARALAETVSAFLPQSGSIVMVSSMADVRHPEDDELLSRLVATEGFEAGQALVRQVPRIRELSYAFSKAAVRKYTTIRAPEFLLRHGVRLNCVSPNVTDTPMLEPAKQTRRASLNIWTPCIGRLATPMEPANAIAFIASQRASYIAGINLRVDGAASVAMDIGMADRPLPPLPQS